MTQNRVVVQENNATANPRITDIWTPDNPYNRAYYPEEVGKIIRKKDVSLNKKQAYIPTLIFFGDDQEPIGLNVDIPEGVNKYHCCVMPPTVKDQNGNAIDYDINRDNPEGLKNILNVHSKEAIKHLKNSHHTLPVTLIYHFGMDSAIAGHVGTIALRIASLDDPSQNEVMVINSLPGYRHWEQAAIEGVKKALSQSVAHKPGKEPKVHVITPTTYPHANIEQEHRGMASSCGGITAEMCCAISPDISFEQQKDQLMEYMASLCGKKNETNIRRQHTTSLHQPQNAMDSSVANIIIAKLLVDPDSIKPTAENLRSGQSGNTLLEVAKKVDDPKIIHHMLKSEPLKQAIQEEDGYQAFNELKQRHVRNDVRDREHRYSVNPKTPKAFVIAMISYPHLLASSMLQLGAANLKVYDILLRVEDKNIIKEFFKNPVLAGSVTPEQKTQLMSRAQEAVHESRAHHNIPAPHRLRH